MSSLNQGLAGIRRATACLASARLRATAAALLALGVLTLSGCGGSLPEVSGTVTVNGQPATAGTVVFDPTGKGAMGIATIQEDGSYTVSTGSEEGLAPGDYAVTVTGNKTPPTEQAGAAPPEPLFPPQYADPKSSGLKYTVTEDGGTYNIPLKK